MIAIICAAVHISTLSSSSGTSLPFFWGTHFHFWSWRTVNHSVLAPTHMDGDILQTTVPRPPVTVASLRGGHTLQEGCFYICAGREKSLGAGTAHLARCMSGHFPISKERAYRHSKPIYRGSRARDAEKQP